MTTTTYSKLLDEWHLRLAIASTAIGRVLMDYPEDDGMQAIAHILKQELADLVESCPFPHEHRFSFAADLQLDLNDLADSLPGACPGAAHD
jgi:hypothetical protein